MAKADIERFQFQPGNPGGGRPKGSRAKLSELAASLLYENFSKNGAETIERVRLKRPEVYLASVIALLPKQAQKVESPFADISDAELEALEQHLAVVRAKLVRDIDATTNNAEPNTRSRVANTETETHGKSIRDNGELHATAPNLDGSHVILDDGDAGILDATTEPEAIMDAPESAQSEHKPLSPDADVSVEDDAA